MSYSQDWTGNKTTAYSQLGASNHSPREREERDLYCTDQVGFCRFLRALKRDKFEIKPVIYEPACGLMHLVEVLERLNYQVVASDIEDRSSWDTCKKTKTKMQKFDFLNDITGVDMIAWGVQTVLTNPPYKYCEDFVETFHKLMRPGQHLIMLLRIQFLESVKRYELFKQYPYRYVYVYVKRIGCSRGTAADEENMASAVCYGWFIWEHSWVGEPTVRFIE